MRSTIVAIAIYIAFIGLAATVGVYVYFSAETDADAQTTWHVEYFALTDASDRWSGRHDAEAFVETLPANCSVDIEAMPDVVMAVAYSCPD
jgi:hypothetical protein